MKKLTRHALIFSKLTNNPPSWWTDITSDPELYIDIRKDNYIDVYYNGGAIITRLDFDGKNFSGKTHYKYLLPAKAEYIQYDFRGPGVNIVRPNIGLLPLANFDLKTLKRIKDNIKHHYPVSSEKGIQAKFIQNAGQFLDSEFAYAIDGKKLRIDLVWLDLVHEKIILTELKTIGDRRLFTNEIYDQLGLYHAFASTFASDILKYYQELFIIKKQLNILPIKLSALTSLSSFSLELKPLLLLGDCEQQWIKNNSESLKARIDKVSVGCYYFGGTNYSCDLIHRTTRNRHIY